MGGPLGRPLPMNLSSGVNWEVRLTGPDRVVGPAQAVLGSLRVHDETLSPLDVTVAPDGRRAEANANGIPLWSIVLPEAGWLPFLVGQVVATATALLGHHLFVHAGAVVIDGRGWVIIGESGAGKTSTVAILVRKGAAYLSDEVALLDPTSGTVAPFALPMAVKPWTAKVAEPLPPGKVVACEGETRFHLPLSRASGPVPIESFILLRPGRAAHLTPVSRAGMLLALAEHPSSLRYRDRLEEAFVGFGRLFRGTACYSLTAPNPPVGADLVAAAARHRSRILSL